MNSYILPLKSFGNHDGYMSIAENNSDIPFEIKRIFYIYDVKSNIIRGQHANRNSKFVLIAVKCSCKIRVIDQENNSHLFFLDKPNCGLFIDNMLWKDMFDFSDDCVLLCLSSELYSADEYIRDFNEYLISGEKSTK